MEIDKGYNKRKIIRYSIIGGTVVIVMIIIFIIFRLMNQVTVKNFVGTNISDANTWGIANKISIEKTEEFNLEYDENMIISQSKDPEKKIQKGSIISFVVSKGPNPDEQIQLPDFSVMTTSEVQKWKEEVKAINVNIVQEFNDTVETNKFIRKEFSNSAVTEKNYTRNDSLLIYMSKGQETYEKNISVPDFKEKTKEEVAEWVKTNEIKATYTEETSDTVASGSVISQDIAAGEKIAKKTAMTFVISLGKAVIVPNFNTMTKEEASAYGGLAVTVKSQYSASVAYGRVISQSVAAGTQLTGEAPEITVVYSEGRPFIGNIKGQTENDLQTYFYEINSKGANITYSIYYVDSSEEKGTAVWSSYYNEFAPLNAYVEIHISRGNLIADTTNNAGLG